MANNAICHIEWQTTDFDNVETFYGGLFGWKFTKWGDTYMLFKPESGPGGGFVKVDVCDSVSYPLIHIEVDDIDSYLKKVVKIGGKVSSPKTEIPEVGWFAILADLDGNTVALYEGSDQ